MAGPLLMMRHSTRSRTDSSKLTEPTGSCSGGLGAVPTGLSTEAKSTYDLNRPPHQRPCIGRCSTSSNRWGWVWAVLRWGGSGKDLRFPDSGRTLPLPSERYRFRADRSPDAGPMTNNGVCLGQLLGSFYSGRVTPDPGTRSVTVAWHSSACVAVRIGILTAPRIAPVPSPSPLRQRKSERTPRCPSR